MFSLALLKDLLTTCYCVQLLTMCILFFHSVVSEAQVDSRPAFEKYHALAQPVPPTLTLPVKYKQLLEKFYAMDTVVSLLHKRSEVCTFSKLKAAVQEMARK